jgi:hypothetical protein
MLISLEKLSMKRRRSWRPWANKLRGWPLKMGSSRTIWRPSRTATIAAGSIFSKHKSKGSIVKSSRKMVKSCLLGNQLSRIKG